MALNAAETAATTYPKPFTISRELPVRRDLAWHAFTDPIEMKQWWGPKGFTIGVSKMDLRPGGMFHYSMVPANGPEMWGRQIYREITPPERIVFINSFSDPEGGLTRHPLAPQWPQEMLSILTFVDLGERSRLDAWWAPIAPTADERAAFDGGHASMTGGWNGTLDKLVRHLSGR